MMKAAMMKYPLSKRRDQEKFGKMVRKDCNIVDKSRYLKGLLMATYPGLFTVVKH